MTSTKLRLGLVAVVLLLIPSLLWPRPSPRPSLHTRAPLDRVLDHLVSHAVSRVQHFTGSNLPEWSTLERKGTYSNPETLALELCALLSGKRLLLIGSDTTYHLHSVLLNALELLEKRSHQCLGRDFCTFHHICRLPSQRLAPSADSDPSARKKKLPSRQMLLLDNSSLLLYSLSYTLYPSLDKQDTAYIHPHVDPHTQVRQSNSFWRRQARKSDIVVINRPPVPAPASTYPNGNWSFARSICVHNNYLAPLPCDDIFENILSNAAIHATLNYFLPSLLDTLRALSVDPEMKETRLLWHSNWYIQPFCARSGLPDFVPLLQDIFFSEKRNALTDPWSYYYNAQGYIHRRLLPKILPFFKITYLSLDTLNDSGPTYLRFFREGQAATWSLPKDCIRHPWPNFSQDVLAHAFFDEMVQVLQAPS